MKLSKLVLITWIASLLMANKCVQDSEEDHSSENDFKEVHFDKNQTVTKNMAIENWEMFLKQSQNAIDLTEANLGNLQIRIDEADAKQKQEWQQVCDYCNLHLIRLKSKRLNRNKQFENELKNYQTAVYQKNEAFETEFSSELETINAKLETLFEKIRSGHYK